MDLAGLKRYLDKRKSILEHDIFLYRCEDEFSKGMVDLKTNELIEVCRLLTGFKHCEVVKLMFDF